MEPPTVAIFTFFSKTTCGYCKLFKGEAEGKDGKVKIDPNGGWQVLTSDLDLQNAGVEMHLYSFGPEQDPKTGKVVNRVLEPEYAAKIRGVPYLELSVPGDPYNGIQFKEPFKSWKAEDVVPVIKKWIFSQLKKEPFKSYADKVKGAPQASSEGMRYMQEPQLKQGNLNANPSQFAPPMQSNGNAPTTFGMGTRETRHDIIKPETKTINRPSIQFLPSNYDK